MTLGLLETVAQEFDKEAFLLDTTKIGNNYQAEFEILGTEPEAYQTINQFLSLVKPLYLTHFTTLAVTPKCAGKFRR